jgi:hypothetical protein
VTNGVRTRCPGTVVTTHEDIQIFVCSHIRASDPHNYLELELSVVTWLEVGRNNANPVKLVGGGKQVRTQTAELLSTIAASGDF